MARFPTSDRVSAPPAGTPSNPNLFLSAPDYVQPYTEQGRLGIERELMKGFSLSATYLYYHGLHLTRTRDINLFAPVPFARVGPEVRSVVRDESQLFRIRGAVAAAATATARTSEHQQQARADERVAK